MEPCMNSELALSRSKSRFLSSISRVEDLLKLDLLSTLRFRLGRKASARVTVHRNTCIKVRPSASITGSGSLDIGCTWPGYCSYKTLFCVWDNATVQVDGAFCFHTGSRVIVDRNARLELGSGGINYNVSIACFKHIKIGDEVFIGENSVIRDSDNHTVLPSLHPQSMPIVIGHHVLIGMNCLILKGVTIGEGTVVAAGSVVNKSLPANVLAGGVPAKIIREGVEWR